MTLIELILAIGVLAMISSITYGAIANAAAMGEEATAQRQIRAMGRNAIEIMQREISLAFISQNQTDYYRTQFKGSDRDPIDEIYFVAKAHKKRYAGVKECDTAEFGYWSEEDRRGGAYRSLLHRESPIIDDQPERGGTVLALSHDVRRLNLRYYDERKEEWLDEWDSESSDQMNRVPHAVEIALELEDAQGRTAAYFVRVPLNQ
jgi:general secretion pathway protein J